MHQISQAQKSSRCIPAVDSEIGIGVFYALPHALVFCLNAHGVGDNDPGVFQVDRVTAIIGQVAQYEHLDGVVWQICMQAHGLSGAATQSAY